MKAGKPIVLTFPAALDKDATASLRTAGFRFNKVLQHSERSPASLTPRHSPRNAAESPAG